MASPAGSSSRLPSYPTGPRDVVSRVASLPDPGHPAHSALLSKLDLSRDSANLWANTQSGIVVCPQRGADESSEGWTQEAGYLLVISTSRRRVARIDVHFVARQSLAFPEDKGKREDDVVFSREVTLDDAEGRGVWLERGLNTFAFVFHLPPTTCVTVYESVSEIRHYVVATVVGSARGLWGKDLTAEEMVYVLVEPLDPEDLVLNHRSADFNDHLGPCVVRAISSNFTIGGGLYVSLDLRSPPPGLRVYAVKASLDLSHVQTSYRTPTKTATLRERATILDKGFPGPRTNQGLAQLRESAQEDDEAVLFDASRGGGEGWSFEDVGRVPPASYSLPGRHNVRASTHPETVTCVRTSTELVIEIFFTSSASPSKLLIATLVRKQVSLYSCGCLPSRISLPDYQESTSEPFEKHKERFPTRCDDSDESVLATEWEHVRALLAARMAGGDSNLVREMAPGRKVGESYDP